MGEFLIPPNTPHSARVWDNPFLWKEGNVYIMANHRLALWCWLQQKDILGRQYSLIHIDEHTDARRWEGGGESECLKEILSKFETIIEFNTYESFQCSCRYTPGRETRPCVTWDNFVHLAAEAKLFQHFYIYSSTGDWHTSLPAYSFNLYKKIADIYNLEEVIVGCEGMCVLDLDLDFFDEESGAFYPEGVTGAELLTQVLESIAKLRHKISMITISINETPGYELWDRRQDQLAQINKILGLGIPAPLPFEDV